MFFKNGSSKIVQEGIKKALEEKENESNKMEKVGAKISKSHSKSQTL